MPNKAHNVILDITKCQFCNKKCGNDTDLKYNTFYQCCEDCINNVQEAISDRKYHEKMSSTYSIN